MKKSENNPTVDLEGLDKKLKEVRELLHGGEDFVGKNPNQDMTEQMEEIARLMVGGNNNENFGEEHDEGEGIAKGSLGRLMQQNIGKPSPLSSMFDADGEQGRQKTPKNRKSNKKEKVNDEKIKERLFQSLPTISPIDIASLKFTLGNQEDIASEYAKIPENLLQKIARIKDILESRGYAKTDGVEEELKMYYVKKRIMEGSDADITFEDIIWDRPLSLVLVSTGIYKKIFPKMSQQDIDEKIKKTTGMQGLLRDASSKARIVAKVTGRETDAQLQKAHANTEAVLSDGVDNENIRRQLESNLAFIDLLNNLKQTINEPRKKRVIKYVIGRMKRTNVSIPDFRTGLLYKAGKKMFGLFGLSPDEYYSIMRTWAENTLKKAGIDINQKSEREWEIIPPVPIKASPVVMPEVEDIAFTDVPKGVDTTPQSWAENILKKAGYDQDSPKDVDTAPQFASLQLTFEPPVEPPAANEPEAVSPPLETPVIDIVKDAETDGYHTVKPAVEGVEVIAEKGEPYRVPQDTQKPKIRKTEPLAPLPSMVSVVDNVPKQGNIPEDSIETQQETEARDNALTTEKSTQLINMIEGIFIHLPRLLTHENMQLLFLSDLSNEDNKEKYDDFLGFFNDSEIGQVKAGIASVRQMLHGFSNEYSAKVLNIILDYIKGKGQENITRENKVLESTAREPLTTEEAEFFLQELADGLKIFFESFHDVTQDEIDLLLFQSEVKGGERTALMASLAKVLNVDPTEYQKELDEKIALIRDALKKYANRVLLDGTVRTEYAWVVSAINELVQSGNASFLDNTTRQAYMEAFAAPIKNEVVETSLEDGYQEGSEIQGVKDQNRERESDATNGIYNFITLPAFKPFYDFLALQTPGDAADKAVEAMIANKSRDIFDGVKAIETFIKVMEENDVAISQEDIEDILDIDPDQRPQQGLMSFLRIRKKVSIWDEVRVIDARNGNKEFMKFSTNLRAHLKQLIIDFEDLDTDEDILTVLLHLHHDFRENESLK